MSRSTAPRNTRYLSEHELKRVLEQVVPAMESRDPERALRLLVGRLEMRIATLGEFYGTLEGSGIWRPTIEDSRENAGSSIEDELVSAIRDSASRALERGVEWTHVLEAVRADQLPITRRIATYLLNAHPAPPRDEVVSALADEAQLAAFLGEYRSLLAEDFRMLDTAERDALVGRISTGPALLPEDADEAQYRAWWTYKRLSVLDGQLPAPIQGQLLELRTRFADEDPNRSMGGTWIGPTSPVTEEELGARSPEEVAEYLASWQPPTGIFVDSPLGLGRRFAIAVERRAEDYSIAAQLFERLHATYVRELLSGLRKAVESGTVIEWEPVISLLEAVMRRDRQNSGSFGEADATLDRMDVDPHWGWARKQAASLLEAGLVDAPHGIPRTSSEAVLGVLQTLAADPEPDAGYESQYGGTNSDWDTLALNTVRPAAITALFRFVVWLSHSERPEDQAVGAAAMGVLTDHLELAADPSLTVRSVYGRSLPLLVGVADEWVEEAIPRVWPLESSLKSAFWAAWSPFITFWRPHIGLFRRLQDPYRRALEETGSEPEWRWVASPGEQLGEQLVAFYLAGEIEYEPWLADFLRRVDERTAESILSAFGRSLDEASSDIVTRSMMLWDARTGQMQAEGQVRPAELSAIAWWFPQPSLPIGWALDHLLSALQLGAEFDFPEEVVRRLVEGVDEAPAKAVACLRLIVSHAEYPWRLERLTEDARTILRGALASPDEDARAAATRAIGELAMLHGHREFRDLLHPQ